MRLLHRAAADRAQAEQNRREELKTRIPAKVAYIGPSLAELVELRDAGRIGAIEAWIAEELRARMRAAIEDSEACARTRPEYRDAVGFGHLVGSLEEFLLGAPGRLG